MQYPSSSFSSSVGFKQIEWARSRWITTHWQGWNVQKPSLAATHDIKQQMHSMRKLQKGMGKNKSKIKKETRTLGVTSAGCMLLHVWTSGSMNSTTPEPPRKPSLFVVSKQLANTFDAACKTGTEAACVTRTRVLVSAAKLCIAPRSQ